MSDRTVENRNRKMTETSFTEQGKAQRDRGIEAGEKKDTKEATNKNQKAKNENNRTTTNENNKEGNNENDGITPIKERKRRDRNLRAQKRIIAGQIREENMKRQTVAREENSEKIKEIKSPDEER